MIAGKLMLNIEDKDTKEINGEKDEQYIIRRYNDLYTKDAFIESIKNDETIKRYYVLKMAMIQKVIIEMAMIETAMIN